MGTILIKNGRLVDPANNIDKIMDVLISDYRISKVSENIDCDADDVIDASGLAVMPGFIDLHVHFVNRDLNIRKL